MTDYLFYKVISFYPEAGDHIVTRAKYICECSEPKKVAHIHPLCGLGHDLTRDNFYTLAGQVASVAEYGDHIQTIEKPEITVGYKIAGEFNKQVELKLPLNPDELRILSEQVLEALRKK